ncbi:terminase small subunit [Saccharibacillus brassicae]|uniref:PBSX phage terminase small subunit-like N-terminal domain-containing protein n=1 Tax=Saccharibacillus brassicae TaxID=2583377 RepID=A0A4Y6V269_SACBS|nr:terminase small subunit [Saccharibacillus brassicae]QDH23464.1 hypothetical protein FFV09_22920 [Saccharibacillus brassicae]
MARERDPRRAIAERLWLESKGKLDLVEVAQQLELSAGTVRGWKKKDGWEDKLAGGDSGSAKGEKKKQKAKTKTTEQTKIASERSVKRSERSDRIRNVPIPENSHPWEQEEETDSGPAGPDGLTDKMRFFAKEYVRTMNATKAAMNAGYSKRSAYSIGSENLRKPEIQTEIKRLQGELSDEIGLDTRRILAEYQKIAFADIGDYVEFGQKEVPVYLDFGPLLDEDGDPVTRTVSYVAFKEADEVDSSLIQEVKMGRDGASIKLYSRFDALKQLEKHLGLEAEAKRLDIDKKKLEIKQLEGNGGDEDLLIDEWVNGVVDDDGGNTAAADE